MRYIFGLFLILCSTCFCEFTPWVNSWEEAVNQSKNESKPICIVFTAPEWCYWCKRLDDDLLLPDFFSSIDQKLVFYQVVVDMDPNNMKQEDLALMETHNIQGFPTVVIVDAGDKEIARTGYLEISPQEYAEYILNKIQ